MCPLSRTAFSRLAAAGAAVVALCAIPAVAMGATYCYGKITGHTPNSTANLCDGLDVDDVVCVPCPQGGSCRGSYECTRRRTVMSGVCQVVVHSMEEECTHCPAGTRARHGKLDPPKAWWRWGWSCRRA